MINSTFSFIFRTFSLTLKWKQFLIIIITSMPIRYKIWILKIAWIINLKFPFEVESHIENFDIISNSKSHMFEFRSIFHMTSTKYSEQVHQNHPKLWFFLSLCIQYSIMIMSRRKWIVWVWGSFRSSCICNMLITQELEDNIRFGISIEVLVWLNSCKCMEIFP